MPRGRSKKEEQEGGSSVEEGVTANGSGSAPSKAKGRPAGSNKGPKKGAKEATAPTRVSQRKRGAPAEQSEGLSVPTRKAAKEPSAKKAKVEKAAAKGKGRKPAGKKNAAEEAADSENGEGEDTFEEAIIEKADEPKEEDAAGGETGSKKKAETGGKGKGAKSGAKAKRHAMAVKAAISEKFGEVEFSFNANKPRKGAFELTLINNEEETVLWSGIKKGPPRKLKFPETEEIVKVLEEKFKLE